MQNLLDKKIKWKNHPTNLRYYFTEFNQQIILLRVNNFPEEPLLTVINRLEILDLEKIPSKWILEGIPTN